MNEIIKKAVDLAKDQYGNYVVQHVFEHGKEQYKEKIMKALRGSLVALSKQKFSSNVIEKCLQYSSDKDKEHLVQEMLGKEGDLNPPLYDMMKDRYANYVVQKAVEMSKPALREALVKKIYSIPDPNNYCMVSFALFLWDMKPGKNETNSASCISCCK